MYNCTHHTPFPETQCCSTTRCTLKHPSECMHPTLHSLKHPECYSTTRCILQLPQLMYSYTPHTPFPETHRRILPPAVPSNYRSQCMHPTRRSMKHKECQSPTRGTLQLPESVYAFYTPLLETQRLLASLPPAVPCNYPSQCMHFTHRSLKHKEC